MSKIDPTFNVDEAQDEHGFIAWLKATRQFPNFLTLLRLILFWVPGVLIAKKKPVAAAAAYAVIAATDVVDGRTARAWRQESNFGRLWDPFADKALVGSSLLGISASGALSAWFMWPFTAITIAREILVSYVRWDRARGSRQLVIPANRDGKIKMVAQSVGIPAAILSTRWKAFRFIAWPAFIISLVYSVKSGIAYVKE